MNSVQQIESDSILLNDQQVKSPNSKKKVKLEKVESPVQKYKGMSSLDKRSNFKLRDIMTKGSP